VAVFPFVAGSVNEEEQQARHALTHRLAAYDALPRQVRVAAAEELESIDDGQVKKTAQTAVRALTISVYGHRLDNRRPAPRPVSNSPRHAHSPAAYGCRRLLRPLMADAARPARRLQGGTRTQLHGVAGALWRARVPGDRFRLR
jgi:hypothetical protein